MTKKGQQMAVDLMQVRWLTVSRTPEFCYVTEIQPLL